MFGAINSIKWGISYRIPGTLEVGAEEKQNVEE
jgi:hypothetical protein